MLYTPKQKSKFDNLIFLIEAKIKQHHSLYRFPLKAELWEDIFDQCINSYDSEWSGGGHDVGADVIVENNDIFEKGSRLQLKSGQIDKNKNLLKWNGHRTTKHKTIESKVSFISDNHYDYFIMLARDKKEWDSGMKKYNLLIFKSDIIDYSKLQWRETYSKNKKNKVTGWVGESPDLPYKAQIYKNMSDQLWTVMNLDCVDIHYKIEI